MKFYSSRQAAELANVALITATVWAQKNEVGYIEEKTRRTFVWTESDIERFKNRQKRGKYIRVKK